MEININQDQRELFETQMKVDYLNKQILKGQPSNKEIQKDAFLRLLVAELKHQNPLDPMKDRDFIAQMAQLTNLEKMEKVSQNIEKLVSTYNNTSVYNMLGKKITYINDAGKIESSAVEAVEFENGDAYIVVNKNRINPKNIMRVE
ncbi:MAG TPA: flagellar hook capping FlgD N-terminal domain-containing protein [Spirochaetota bacterium]|nr:flagellar hook capping FlgD N-terminal domain-containing protein [Spirochaetota bacterium]HOM37992.1 flagellar hook capping FlgD N-terminal domain-containing protein [Spirochaetota bacterium]HPQ48796.1 flagellar hook capping FlgD N-terminal domain-containing protein [Spirochaetota bacterium]